MTATRLLRYILWVCFAMLVVAGCGRSREEKRILLFSDPGPVAPEAAAALREIGEEEGIEIVTATDSAAFVEDALSQYSAVVFLNSSGDALDYRQQADLERYVQAGGGVIGIGAKPARTWPWFNELLGSGSAGKDGAAAVRREWDGGRAFVTQRGAQATDFADPVFLDQIREGIDYAIGKNRLSNYARAHTERVPEANRFEQDVLLQGTLDEPTELAVASDGRVFITERKGALKLYEPGSGEPRLIEQLEVNHESENGLIGLTLDPDFDQNHWLYLNYSVPGALKHRVARFTFTGSGLTDEKILFEVPFDEGCCHTGGSMAFGPGGNLYVSFGDNTNPFDAGPYAPIDPAPGRAQMDARRSSANTQDLRGKILRITPQPNGTYSIPAGNLFTDRREGRPEIYTMGHRNPYRISVDPHTGDVFWGEVGPDARTDSVYGPKGYDEVNRASQAGNFGWPMFIANNKRYLNYNFTSGWRGDYFDPRRPVNDSPNNTGAKVLPPAQPALIYYPYDSSEEFPRVGEGGRNAMAGPVYHYADFRDSGTKLPEYYDGKFIHYDWMRGWMMASTLDEQGNFVKMEPFLENLEFDHPIDMALGPDGSLYVLEYGTYWFAKNPTARLSRITFHAGNRPPTADLAVSDSVGAAPLTVRFSAAGSADYDEGDTLQYGWNFGGGDTAEGATATHTFTEPGTYPVRVVVRDPSGATAEATTRVRVGNAPPRVKIAWEGNRSFFWGAGPVDYRVNVTDAEDGTLGRGIDPQRVRVTFDYLPEGIGRAAVMPGHQTNITPKGLSLIEGSDCTACHGIDQTSVGPSFRMVAERYTGKAESVPYLINKIIEGGGGVWGEHSMAAHPNLAPEEAEEMVRYIFSLTGGGAKLPPAGTLRLDRHKPGESGTYIVAATYSDEARNGVGPLQVQDQIVLRPPFVRAADLSGTRYIGTTPGEDADGTERLVATAYDNGAFLPLGPTDLTGVGEIRFGFQSLANPFTLELRDGGPEGKLLASRAVQVPAKDQWFEAAIPVKTNGEGDLYIVLRSDVEGLGQWSPLVRIGDIRFERDGSGR